MNVPYNIVLDEAIYVEEKDYQRIKKNLNKNDDYFSIAEINILLIDNKEVMCYINREIKA